MPSGSLTNGVHLIVSQLYFLKGKIPVPSTPTCTFLKATYHNEIEGDTMRKTGVHN